MIWLWAALLVVGLALLLATLVRVLVGGLADERSHPRDRPGPPSPDPGPSRARELLDERYAAGDLTTEEYLHRRRVLSRGDDER